MYMYVYVCMYDFPIVGHSDVAFSFDWNRLFAITEKVGSLATSIVAIQCVSRYLGQRATHQPQCPVQRLGRRSRCVVKSAVFRHVWK